MARIKRYDLYEGDGEVIGFGEEWGSGESPRKETQDFPPEYGGPSARDPGAEPEYNPEWLSSESSGYDGRAHPERRSVRRRYESAWQDEQPELAEGTQARRADRDSAAVRNSRNGFRSEAREEETKQIRAGSMQRTQSGARTEYQSPRMRRDGFDQHSRTPAREPEEPRQRYFAGNRDESVPDAPSTLFDDFDRFNDPGLQEIRRPRKKKKKLKHKGAWGASIFLSLTLILCCAWLTIPQMTDTRYRFLPTPAFANGSVLLYDSDRESSFQACRREIYHQNIYPGVYIDGVHVGGMSRAAAEALLTKNEENTADFDITITVGNQSWHVTPERVPVTRNAGEMVSRAWAMGRVNSPSLRGTGATPFGERMEKASALRSYPVSLQTTRTWDHAALKTLCDGIVNYVNRDPVNASVATFDFGTRAFTFTEDRPGAVLDADQLYQKTAAMLDAGDYHGSLFVTPEKRIADVTKTELMNSFGKISSYTTKTTSNNNRNTNISLSARAINGITVLPGEIFSFNAATGERTAAKGYREAAAISGGQTQDEIGGGVCQTSSTLFNAVARANLEIVERSPHAWPSNYVEKGFDATVNWPGLDFKFKNNSGWPVFIIAEYENRKITVSIYGMSLGVDTSIDLESVTTRVLPKPAGTNYVINTSLAVGEARKTVTGREGYIVETWKIWKQGGREIKRELLFTSTYKAYQETIEYNPQ